MYDGTNIPNNSKLAKIYWYIRIIKNCGNKNTEEELCCDNFNSVDIGVDFIEDVFRHFWRIITINEKSFQLLESKS